MWRTTFGSGICRNRGGGVCRPATDSLAAARASPSHADQDLDFIGDSATRGHFGEVEKHLAGKAYCARLTTSKCVSDPFFSDEVPLLLKQYRFAVVHFNNALHGWGYTEDPYRDGLLRLMATFKEQAAGAKLIWATTTPVRDQGNLQQNSQRTERVKARNQIAAEIMQQRGIPTDDLYGLVEAHPEFFSGDGVHYNTKGREVGGPWVNQPRPG